MITTRGAQAALKADQQNSNVRTLNNWQEKIDVLKGNVLLLTKQCQISNFDLAKRFSQEILPRDIPNPSIFSPQKIIGKTM